MNSPVRHDNDVLLVRRASAGERDAIDSLIDRMACIPAMLAGKNRRLSVPFSADDLLDMAQDAFTRIWSRLDSFTGEGCLEAWAYRFCHHVMMNAQQRQIRRREREDASKEQDDLPADGVEPGRESATLDRRSVLHEAVKGLDPAEAEVVELKHFEGLSFTEIARRVDVSPNSAKTRYYRAIRRLEQRLRPIFGEERR